MLYNLFAEYSNQGGILNLFRYLTFRSGGAILTAMLLSFFFTPHVIRILKRLQKEGQPIRQDGPKEHLITKKGTPTMGGVMILLCIIISSLLWADLSNIYVWIVLATAIFFGGIGFWDDFLKLTKNSSRGLKSRHKFLLQMFFSMIMGYLIYDNCPEEYQNRLAFPFFKDALLYLGFFSLLFVAIVITGSSNAVNLTDGLDGLAIVPSIIAFASFGLIAYIVGRVDYTDYLHLNYIPGTGELAVICAAMIGSGLGFLWYNAPPAQVFMGDTGSLALGAMLGVISVITKHEIVLAIIGGLFVMEALSVIMQVMVYKKTGKRIFLMAPIHHHFEKKGWSEATIVIRFWIIAFIFALIGLASLKIR